MRFITPRSACSAAREYSSVGGDGTFNGLPYTATDTLVKYTYYGDTDFNGVINFDDYSRTDSGFNNNRQLAQR